MATKDMVIANILQMGREKGTDLAPLFLAAGLRCASGCPSAQRETLEDAGVGHGVDVDALIVEINEQLGAA